MIRPLLFVDASRFTAHFIVKYAAQQQNGILALRDVADDVDVADLPILKEWKSARTLLLKIRNQAAPFLSGKVPELGKVWIETLPPESATPWTHEIGDYADEHHRLRICLIPGVDCYSFCGEARVILNVGIVNLIDHKKMCSEANMGQFARTHLIVDIRKPDEDAAPEA